jgi:hypothetical protein
LIGTNVVVIILNTCAITTQKNRGTEVPPFLSRIAFFGSFTAPVAVPLMGMLAVFMKSRFEYGTT